MLLVPGQQYRLVLPPEWLQEDPPALAWNHQIVTYYKTGTDMEEIWDRCWYGSNPAPFTAWIKGPAHLTTAYRDNIFLAKPEWLQEVQEVKEVYLSPFTGLFVN
jgi:hypothetical protein